MRTRARRPFIWGRSTRAKPAVGDALAPHLLARHFHNERFKIRSREILADTFEAARQIFSHVILSAMRTLGIEMERVRRGRRARSNQPIRN